MDKIPEYKGVPDTQAIRDDLGNYACDDCPWNLIEEALNEVDRLRAIIAEQGLRDYSSGG